MFEQLVTMVGISYVPWYVRRNDRSKLLRLSMEVRTILGSLEEEFRAIGHIVLA